MPPETRRCPSCGSRLEYRNPDDPQEESDSSGLPSFSLPEINLSTPAWVGICVTTAVLLVGGMFMLFGRNQGPAQDPGPLNE